MIAGRCIGAVFTLLLACGPRGTAAPDGEVRGEEAAADAAERRGSSDVAAAWRGRAFVRAPTVARMDAWVDALVAGGEASRAREGLAEAMTAALARRDFELYNACARRLRGLPVTREEAIAVTGLSPGLTAAYAAEAAGSWRAAAAAFAAAGSDAPVHRARAGEVYAELGDMDEARRQWAAARAGFHARGAALELVPVRWRGSAAGWRGEVLTTWAWGSALLDHDRRAPRFAVLHGARARGVAVVGAFDGVAFTADGREFVVTEGRTLVLRDVLSGLLRRELGVVDEVPAEILTSGTGEDLKVLASGAPTTLWDRHGRLLASFPLPPDRVDPSAVASAVAMTAGATQVAVGGHGGAIRVFAGGQGVTLTETTPDRNAVRALGFDREGRLVAVHGRGDVVGWDPRSGRELWHHGLCASDPDACAYVRARVDLSADASRAVFGPLRDAFIEVSTVDGRILRRLGDVSRSGSQVLVSPGGAVALAGDGATVWRPGAATPEVQPPRARRRSVGTWLSRDGRVLYGPGSANHRGPDVVWDVVAGRRLPVTRDKHEWIVAMREDGRRAAVRTEGAIEIRDTDTGAAVATVAVTGGVDVDLPLSGHVVVRQRREPRWVIVAPDGRRSEHAIGDEVLAISADGRWIVSEGPGSGGTLAVSVRRLAAPAEVVHVLGFHADEVVFTRDGSRVAWLERSSKPNGPATVHVRSLVGEPAPANVRVADHVTGLAFGVDEREVWFIASGWMRWQPDTGALTAGDGKGTVRRVTTDGRTIRAVGITETRVLRVGSPPVELGQLVALDSGEWLAVSAAGAIDGSPGAIDELVTWVQQGGTDLVFAGRLGWDAAHVDGLVGRMLAGEDVAPPVRMRRATRR